MQNLIIYSDFTLHYSETAAGNRMAKYAKAIAADNCKVYILSRNCYFNPYNPKVYSFSPNCFYVGEQSKIKINLFSFVRNINEFSNTRKGLSRLLFYPSNSALMDWLSLIYLKYLCKKKVFIEINERRFYYKDISVFKNVKIVKIPVIALKFIVNKASMRISEHLVRHFDGMIFISRNIENYFKLRVKKTYIRIPILSDPVVYSPKFISYNNTDVFQIGFSGQIRVYKENLHLLLKALHSLKDKGLRIKLNLYGPIIEREQFYELIRREGIENEVEYHGNIEYEQLGIELKKNHLLVNVRGKTQQNFYGFSTKLSDYISLGIPVLLTKVSDVNYFFKDNYNSFLIDPDSEKAISEKLEEIIRTYNILCPKIVSRAIKLVNNEFSYQNHTNRLKSFFTQTLT